MSVKIISNKASIARKKIVLLLLCVCVTMSICACGKSEATKNAEEAIESIGTVTLESLEKIENAEKLYGILTDAEKEKVENRLLLVEARETYDKLQEEESKRVQEANQEVIYEKAKLAYDNLAAMAEVCSLGMDSVYSAWYFGIYQADGYNPSGIFTKLGSETGLSSSKLETAASNLGYDKYNMDDWQHCVLTVLQVYVDAGIISEMETDLVEINDTLHELNATYSDTKYYPLLVEYYGKVSAYYEFFKSPTGSFSELSGNISSYENDIIIYQNQLSVLFK